MNDKLYGHKDLIYYLDLDKAECIRMKPIAYLYTKLIQTEEIYYSSLGLTNQIFYVEYNSITGSGPLKKSVFLKYLPSTTEPM